MTAPQSTPGTGVQPNKRPVSDAYTFRAPRTGDLVSCPYCDREPPDCDFCGGEGEMLIEEVMRETVEFDLHRLDCAVDALKGADLTQHRAAVRRIAENLRDLMEPMQ